MLADDMGLGKTRQAILAAVEVNAFPVLILCPAIGRVSWMREFRKLGMESEVALVVKGADIAKIPARKFTVISIPIFRDNAKAYQDRFGDPAVLILDEAQNIKNLGGKANKAISPLALRVDRFWPMSGTFIKNHYGEFFANVRLIVPFSVLQKSGLTNEFAWRDRFCEVEWNDVRVKNFKTGRWEWKKIPSIVGSKNAAELKALIAPYWLRRTKAILKSLPGLKWQALPVEGFSRAKYTAGELAEAARYAESGGQVPEHIMRQRAELAMALVPAAQGVIEEHCESDKSPILVFCSHVEPIAVLQDALKARELRVAAITGATSPAARAKIEEDYQNGLYDVLLGQTIACGTSLTLTRGNRVLFIDLPWSPGDAVQARDRAHRIGQESEVLAQYLDPVDNELAQRVNEILYNKTLALAEVLQ